MFAVYNFLFVGLNILFAKRYAFVRSNTGVRALWKNIWKIKFSKYSQEWSCLEDLDIKNTFVQSEFNLDIHSVIYGFFFASNFFACGWCHCFVLSICMHMLFYFYVQTVRFIGLKSGPPRVELFLEAMAGVLSPSATSPSRQRSHTCMEQMGSDPQFFFWKFDPQFASLLFFPRNFSKVMKDLAKWEVLQSFQLYLLKHICIIDTHLSTSFWN